ncbi:hypothetical protein [Compostimonas suwonensis]|uniref:MinD-like ATPase involved in chromosome partitioning or flagellar assembly n=1 Tax=Compostimonas suwonensis TaxID=1048394 RepID=A0A2M9C5A3_9MICO|nr:hypothetical protein [Compostimonas suwonensis]PJJ65698.1 hypothetical protein CLV54_0735 [Compostimonas suwonensis]
MSGAPRIVVAGTAGGVGTTTVAALLVSEFALGGAPAILDHSDGALAERLPATVRDARGLGAGALAIHDLGAFASGEGAAALVAPGAIPVIVTAATPLGCALAERAIAGLRTAAGDAAPRRLFVVPVAVHGRHDIGAALKQLSATHGARIPAVLPRDHSLAAGGPVIGARLDASTARAISALGTGLRALLG